MALAFLTSEKAAQLDLLLAREMPPLYDAAGLFLPFTFGFCGGHGEGVGFRHLL